jgi:uncharacterized protein (DUF885 family)
MDLSRRDILLASGATAALSALPAFARGQASAADGGALKLLDAIAEQLLVDGPEGATTLGIDKAARAALKGKLTDRSAAGQKTIADHLKAAVAQLKAVDPAPLSPVMRTNIDVVRTSYETAIDGFAFPYGDVAVGGWRNTPYVVAQNVGAFLDIPRLLESEHRVDTRADAEAYLSRLESYAAQLDGETGRLRSAAGHGVIAPDFLLDKALKQMAMGRGGEIADWGLVTTLGKATAKMPGDYAARAALLARDKVAPALDRQIAELQAHRAKATSDAGVWKFPDGDAYYAWALRAGTTTRMTPDEVHEMGKAELRTLQAEMDVILKAEGFTQGSVGERMTALGKDPRYLYPDNDAGRAEIMALLRDRVAHIRQQMPRAFATLVPGNVEVKRLPLTEEPGAPGAYGGPGSIDGKVPGKLWINLRTTGLWTRYSLPTLAYHESIPGHVWQGEYTFKLPLIRSMLAFNAYSEGWALYAEQLGSELGAYDGDPIGRLGYLQSIAFRACRLVVDTGLHAKRWTREQAVQWFATTNGSSVEEVAGEVDRYCSWPGQACGYKVGHSEINRLRRKAQADLGARYDLRRFDDAVVLGGNVPMTVLGHNIDAYIAAAKG